jgi:NAD(P)-dependent dehydrogenase (short-subunit alcohol dehydrogenase family)
MVAEGGGRIINVISGAGFTDPPAAPGEGGWGVLYGMVKAGQHRIAGSIKAEYPGSGILCFSVNPGFVKTPVIRELPVFRTAEGGISATVPAAVIGWLATSDDAERFNCQLVDAPDFARAHLAVET